MLGYRKPTAFKFPQKSNQISSRTKVMLVQADVAAKDDKDGAQLADKDVAKLLSKGLSGYSSSERLASLIQQFEVSKTTVEDLGRRKMQPQFLMQQFGLALGEALAVLDLADPRTTSQKAAGIVARGAVKRNIAVLDLTQPLPPPPDPRTTSQKTEGIVARGAVKRNIAVLDLTQPLPPPPDPRTTSQKTEGIVARGAVKRNIAVLDLTQPLPPPPDPRTTSQKAEGIVARGAVKRNIAVLDLTQPLPPPPDPRTTSQKTEGIVAGGAVKRKIAVPDLTQPLPPTKYVKPAQSHDAGRKPITSTALVPEFAKPPKNRSRSIRRRSPTTRPARRRAIWQRAIAEKEREQWLRRRASLPLRLLEGSTVAVAHVYMQHS